ncbi:2607_t:CDS:2 [Acaulospora colombiana]|uniref:2607_t:CDS:1 n=1 Tax=Acaulospora colombiana TaxID=27376 RepID=A0ACA9K6N6_9GLOM|nr:2607_t:CDS:2 [Acaulospora colombiana]
MSDTSTPANASNENEEKQAPTLAEVFRKLNTEKLIEFLCGEEDLQLDENDLKIFRDEKITSRDSLRGQGEKNEVFSSYRSLKEVLGNMIWNPESIDAIPLFKPPISEIRDDDVYFEECITEINKRLRNYGTLYPDSLKAMRNEYVVAILHTALHIVRDDTKREFSMRPQQEIIDEESSGRVDYAIKGIGYRFSLTYLHDIGTFNPVMHCASVNMEILE